jgi:hypothetical protein
VADAARVVSTAIMVVAGLVVAIGLVLVAGLYVLSRPPDVEGAATSRSVRFESGLAAEGQNAELDAVVAGAPGATVLGESLVDRCFRETGFMAVRSHAACDRSAVRYLAFNGDRARLQTRWDRARVPSQHDGINVTTTWAERPTVPRVELRNGTDEVVREERSADVAALCRAAYARYRYIVAVHVTTMYYPVT